VNSSSKFSWGVIHERRDIQWSAVDILDHGSCCFLATETETRMGAVG
jgi:hypothetical protein